MTPSLSETEIRYQGVIIWNTILKANINPDSLGASFKIMLNKQFKVNLHGLKVMNSHYCGYIIMILYNIYALPALVINNKWLYCYEIWGPQTPRGFLSPFAIWLIFFCCFPLSFLCLYFYFLPLLSLVWFYDYSKYIYSYVLCYYPCLLCKLQRIGMQMHINIKRNFNISCRE